MITHLIFDLDGTIADTEELHFKAWQKTLLDHGVPSFDFEDFRVFIGTSNEKVAGDYLPKITKEATATELIKYKQDLYIALIPQVELCAGVAECIKTCAQSYTIAVASSSHEKEVRKILEHHGLIDYFKEIVCGDMVQNKKPDPEIYLLAAKRLGVEPQYCMAFEDTEHGVNAAKAAGMRAIAIPTLFSQHHNFERADRILKSFDEVDGEFFYFF